MSSEPGDRLIEAVGAQRRARRAGITGGSHQADAEDRRVLDRLLADALTAERNTLNEGTNVSYKEKENRGKSSAENLRMASNQAPLLLYPAEFRSLRS
ncbi:hypothetical protein ABIB94_009332 [Bradyrhizobium sp. JR7.2]